MDAVSDRVASSLPSGPANALAQTVGRTDVLAVLRKDIDADRSTVLVGPAGLG